jgi:plasmid stabilization system protein ParE
MNSRPVVALPEVIADLRAAMDHYASWRSSGATELLDKYDDTVGWIAWNPEAFPRKFGAVRRAIVRRSYFVVYFTAEMDRSVVLAVLDGRRNPAEIRSILSQRRRRKK